MGSIRRDREHILMRILDGDIKKTVCTYTLSTHQRLDDCLLTFSFDRKQIHEHSASYSRKFYFESITLDYVNSSDEWSNRLLQVCCMG